MKILFLTNNDISERLQRWLVNEAKEDVLVYGNKISAENITQVKPDFLVSYNYRHIIKQDVLEILPRRIINLHISYLPWNKGAHPNLWSFLENSPKGVTIHFIDKGLDTGDILCQQEAFFDEEKETVSSSYLILHQILQNLFIEKWSQIKNNELNSQSQGPGGSMHFKRDYDKIEFILGKEGWDLSITELKKRYKLYKDFLLCDSK